MLIIITSIIKILSDIKKCVKPTTNENSKIDKGQINCLENRVIKLEKHLENFYDQDIIDIKLNGIEKSQVELKSSQQDNFNMVFQNSQNLSEIKGELKVLMRALYYSKQ